MGKPTFQRKLSESISTVAPCLRYIAFYKREDERSIYRSYKDRCFIYTLSVLHNGTEKIVYVGKTTGTYSRALAHFSSYEYDKIYLFECDSELLNDSEKKVIDLFEPIYNIDQNPSGKLYKKLLNNCNVDIKADKAKKIFYSKERIYRDLTIVSRYFERFLYGVELPPSIFQVILKIANDENITFSELILSLIEEKYFALILKGLEEKNVDNSSNLIKAKTYADLHSISVEQVKQYLRQPGRIKGSIRLGRDWVILNETALPKDDLRKAFIQTNI